MRKIILRDPGTSPRPGLRLEKQAARVYDVRLARVVLPYQDGEMGRERDPPLKVTKALGMYRGDANRLPPTAVMGQTALQHRW